MPETHPSPGGLGARPEDRSTKALSILAEYLAAIDEGGRPDRDALLAAHPDVAVELGTFLDDQDFITDYCARTALDIIVSPGAKLPAPFGKYRLLEVLGQGGMGIVYKAWDASLGRNVALKMILTGRIASVEDGERKRFDREKLSIARLDHPHIVPVHDSGDVEGVPYFTMKLIEGSSLTSSIEELSRDSRRSAQLLAKVAHAIHHAHERSVLHRDLKPDNVLVDTDGEPFVADFGLAMDVEKDSSLTRSGSYVGAMAYLAPEQARDPHAVHTEAADIHALGLILYELLTGKKAFEGATPLGTVRLIASEEPIPPTRLRPKIPRDLETICLKCLEKDPGKRYRLAEELALDLERFLAGEPIQARPANARERLVKWARRRPLVATSLSLVLAAALLVVGLTAWYVQSLRDANTEIEARVDELKESNKVYYRTLFATTMDRAFQAMDRYQIDVAGHLADLLDPNRQGTINRGEELRSFDWYHLRKRILAEESQQIHGSVAAYNTVAFSLDDATMVVAGSGRSPALLPRWSWKESIELSGEIPRVSSAAFSPDGQLIAACSEKGRINVWSARGDLAELSTIVLEESLCALAFLPDGRGLVTAGSSGEVHVMKVPTLAPIRSFKAHRGAVRSAVFGGSPAILATSGDDGAVNLWDPADWSSVASLPSGDRPVSGVAISPDGKLLAAACGDGRVRFWDLASHLEAGPTIEAHEGAALCVAFSADGKLLATGGEDALVHLWDARARSLVRSFTMHSMRINAVAFSQDGKLLVSAGGDESVRGWDLTALEEMNARREPLTISTGRDVARSITFTGPQELFTVMKSGEVLRWALGPRGEGASITARVTELKGSDSRTMVLSSDATWLARGEMDGTIQIWGLEWGDKPGIQSRATRLLSLGEISKRPVRALAWSSESRTLASLSANDAVELWAAAGPGPGVESWVPRGRLEESSHNALWEDVLGTDPERLEFFQDGKGVAVVGLHSWNLDVYDVGTKRRRATLHYHTGGIGSVASIAGTETLFTGGNDKQIYRWDLKAAPFGATLEFNERHMMHRHPGPITSLTCSPDQRLLASGSTDGGVKLWEPRLGIGGLFGVLRANLTGPKTLLHSGEVTAISFSPNMQALVTAGGVAGAHGELKVWRTTRMD